MKKSFRIVLIVLLCVCVFVAGCIIFRSPLAQFCGFVAAYIDSDKSIEAIKEYRGASYFISEEYVDFHQGRDFKASIELYNLTEYGEVADFYHRDYTKYNRRYIAEYPNSFILDIQASDENYTLAKTKLTENMQYRSDKGPFHLYDEKVVDDDYGKTYMMIGFNDTKKTIRYIYVISNGDDFSSMVWGSQLLTRYTSPDLWKTDQ